MLCSSSLFFLPNEFTGRRDRFQIVGQEVEELGKVSVWLGAGEEVGKQVKKV